VRTEPVDNVNIRKANSRVFIQQLKKIHYTIKKCFFVAVAQCKDGSGEFYRLDGRQ